ncbi:hypothetical protein Dda_9188 [Drechslerella dactyloides]|uniref:Uncharacterized protein n=1 Tax=Drechslerella dactyloides TaxID=74499 RepID=A0AAD6ISD1_DREDA|nr:hypothetical protein Dda_9188 [Drechslerella dactyloides]
MSPSAGEKEERREERCGLGFSLRCLSHSGRLRGPSGRGQPTILFLLLRLPVIDEASQGRRQGRRRWDKLAGQTVHAGRFTKVKSKGRDEGNRRRAAEDDNTTRDRDRTTIQGPQYRDNNQKTGDGGRRERKDRQKGTGGGGRDTRRSGGKKEGKGRKMEMGDGMEGRWKKKG